MDEGLSERQIRAIENTEKAKAFGGRVNQTSRSLAPEDAIRTARFGPKRGKAKRFLKDVISDLGY